VKLAFLALDQMGKLLRLQTNYTFVNLGVARLKNAAPSLAPVRFSNFLLALRGILQATWRFVTQVPYGFAVPLGNC